MTYLNRLGNIYRNLSLFLSATCPKSHATSAWYRHAVLTLRLWCHRSPNFLRLLRLPECSRYMDSRQASNSLERTPTPRHWIIPIICYAVFLQQRRIFCVVRIFLNEQVLNVLREILRYTTIGEHFTVKRTDLIMTTFGNFRSVGTFKRHFKDRRYEN